MKLVTFLSFVICWVVNSPVIANRRCYKCDNEHDYNQCFKNPQYCAIGDVCFRNETIVKASGSSQTSHIYNFGCEPAQKCTDSTVVGNGVNKIKYCCCGTETCDAPDGTGSGGLRSCLFNVQEDTKSYVGERCQDVVPDRVTYRLFTLETKNQKIAFRNCQSVGGTLATVASEDEAARIMGLNFQGKCSHAWLSLQRFSGAWWWHGQHGQTRASFEWWKNHEPAMPGQADKHQKYFNYAVMDLCNDGKWTSQSENSVKYQTCFVCELPKNKCERDTSYTVTKSNAVPCQWSPPSNAIRARGIHAFLTASVLLINFMIKTLLC